MTCLNPCPPPSPPFPRPSLEGGRRVQQNFIRGGSAPRSNSLPFYIPFLAEKVPFLYTPNSQMEPLSHTYSLRQKQLGHFHPTLFFLLLACLLVLPMLLITVNSPNLAHQQWEGKKTVVSQQFWLRLVFRTLQPF